MTSITLFVVGCTSSFSNHTTDTPKNALQNTVSDSGLKIATWNVEHLAYPITTGCRPRTDAEIMAMKAYAKSLNADIVALQEVASEQALAQIFPNDEWRIIMSQRADSPAYTCRQTGSVSTQQKVAFAIKKTVPVLKHNAVEALGLAKPGLRYGLQITVNSQQGPTDILNVHMKSGCFVDDYLKSDSAACQTYAQQAPILNNWIAQHEAAGTPYIILGDFNHRLSAPYNRLTRTILNDSRSTRITTRDLLGCQARYPAPIDQIIVGGMSTKKITQSAHVHLYKNMDENAMLSDHCAVSVSLFNNPGKLSSATVWQTKSKEYQLLSTHMYQQAEKAVENLPKTMTNWVAVMDVDETVLNNSAYQKQTELSHLGYSDKTWQAWVKSEKATLVPGAKSFIEAVYKKGGKVALITNRNKQYDTYTWNNLKSVGLPISSQNTCLIGRSQADKDSVDNHSFINDKDLRRQQITLGTGDCFKPQGQGAQKSWQQPQVIQFQVGDNIEDFIHVTQQSANVEALLPQVGKSLFLLPNPMYGSW